MTEATLEQALHVDIDWIEGEPPPSRRGQKTSAYRTIAQALSERPLQWARVAGPFDDAKAANRRSANCRSIGLDAVYRTTDNGATYHVYARFVPGEQHVIG